MSTSNAVVPKVSLCSGPVSNPAVSSSPVAPDLHQDEARVLAYASGDMSSALHFSEGDPALSSSGGPELLQDEAQVVAEPAAKGMHSLCWDRPRSVGAGLQNTGNSCYLNAALQCLTHTPPLANYMMSQEHSQSCRHQEGCTMCALEAHVTQSLLHSHSGDVMKPSQMLTSAFHTGKQEDAHEFLMFTLNAMHTSCLQVCEQSEAPSKDSTLVHEMFGGSWRSQIKCLYCQGTSDSYDPFLDIPLDISSAQSVNQALEDLVKAEELCGDNAYYCSRCGEKRPASKTLTVQSPSKVLLLVLNRFSDFLGDKLDREVSYPEFLDLQPFLSQPNRGPLPYALYAVLVHDGVTCHSGHYFCCVKAGDGKWYKMDDSKVSRCDVTSVLSEPAYVLFYVQQTDLKKVSVGVPEGSVHGVLGPEWQLQKAWQRKHKRWSCSIEATGETLGNRKSTATREISLEEWKVLQEQNHPKAVLNLRKTELTLPANAIVIHPPRHTVDRGRNAPDKENRSWHSADRFLTAQGPMNTEQLYSQGGRQRSRKKNKQGRRPLHV